MVALPNHVTDRRRLCSQTRRAARLRRALSNCSVGESRSREHRAIDCCVETDNQYLVM